MLSSTKNNLNKWVSVKANVKEDFKKFHNLDVNELDGVAIMSDTDNSKMKTITHECTCHEGRSRSPEPRLGTRTVA